jgi:hypothetical protein
MTGQTFQQYIRIFLYNLFAALASYSITVPDNTKTLILSVAGIMGNLAWTMYGTRLNGLLEQVKEKTGVQSIEIKVDPDMLPPSEVNLNTSAGITAKPTQ